MVEWRKPKKVQVIENEHGKAIEDILLPLLNKHGLTGTAKIFSVSIATVGYWNLHCGITQLYVKNGGNNAIS